MYRSQIRQSEINELLEKVSKGNYAKYLSKLYLKKVRGFTDQIITFDFPVTSIIGPNGGGKTTVLGAAAILYKEIKPRLFFAKSRQLDKNMKDWIIEYEIIDKEIDKKKMVRRTASFKSEKWGRQSCDRSVQFFGVARTLPAVERKDMLKLASDSSIKPDELVEIDQESCGHITRVLGKNVAGFRHYSSPSELMNLLAGKTPDGIDYSEFHFGAGESSIIKMISKIESLGDSSLVLIEEIENGLHPIATRFLVEYLIEVSSRKKLQVIFSTHSDYATAPLPPQAIWSVVGGGVFQGKMSVESLRSITGEVESQLIVYVEDDFAKSWIQSIVRQKKVFDFSMIDIHAVGGDGSAVNINKFHNQDPATKCKSICIIDGDSHQMDGSENKVYRLPGQVPESYVFNKVIEKWDEFGAKLSIALMQPFENSDKINKILFSIRDSNREPHLLFNQLSESLLIPPQTAMDAFLTIWCQAYKIECDAIHHILEENNPQFFNS